jgi:hypothetical protein
MQLLYTSVWRAQRLPGQKPRRSDAQRQWEFVWTSLKYKVLHEHILLLVQIFTVQIINVNIT